MKTITTINRFLERVSPDLTSISEEQYKELQKDMKKARNKRYYEKHKERIRLKNADIIKDRYQNDTEYREHVKTFSREWYDKKRKTEQAEYCIQIEQLLEQNIQEEF